MLSWGDAVSSADRKTSEIDFYLTWDPIEGREERHTNRCRRESLDFPDMVVLEQRWIHNVDVVIPYDSSRPNDAIEEVDDDPCVEPGGDGRTMYCQCSDS